MILVKATERLKLVDQELNFSVALRSAMSSRKRPRSGSDTADDETAPPPAKEPKLASPNPSVSSGPWSDEVLSTQYSHSHIAELHSTYLQCSKNVREIADNILRLKQTLGDAV